MQAKDNLNGADIYTGCNTLKIEFSKVLPVKNIVKLWSRTHLTCIEEANLLYSLGGKSLMMLLLSLVLINYYYVLVLTHFSEFSY